ncbi:MAG: acyltransferase family protein [Methylomicrobium sp.]
MHPKDGRRHSVAKEPQDNAGIRQSTLSAPNFTGKCFFAPLHFRPLSISDILLWGFYLVTTLSNKILNIQALRGIAVMLVIAFHLAGNEEKYGHGYTILPDFLAIGSSGVDIFFVISGFVMVTITRGRFRKTGAIRKFIYHRVTRIYPVYWFYSVLMLAIIWVQWETSSSTRVIDMTASFLLLPQNQLPLLVVGWTLVHEMYFYFVFSLLLAFHERWLSALMILWCVASIIGAVILSSTENPIIQLIVNPLTLEFITGGLIARAHFSGKSSFAWLLLILAVAWWILGYGICVKLGLAPESSSWLRLLLFGVPSAFFVYALVALEKSSGWRMPSWLMLIGDASFSIYLSHLLVIAFIGRIWEAFGLVGPYTNGIVLIAMLLSALVIGITSFRLIELPLLNFTRRFEPLFVLKRVG